MFVNYAIYRDLRKNHWTQPGFLIERLQCLACAEPDHDVIVKNASSWLKEEQVSIGPLA
jgi:hypothetical protein